MYERGYCVREGLLFEFVREVLLLFECVRERLCPMESPSYQ